MFPPPPLVATVVIGPVPDIPLASLAGLIAPVVDDLGQVVDWIPGDDERWGPEHAQTYRIWRRAWERAWELGPLTHLRSLHRRAVALAADPDVTALLDALVTRPGEVQLDPSSVPDLPAQLEALRAAVAAEDREATA
ncbi:MAG: hypothetical protein ACRDZZ_13480, partial [Ilumatobacteraceae bacterium]